jgi:hypothetical protein
VYRTVKPTRLVTRNYQTVSYAAFLLRRAGFFLAGAAFFFTGAFAALALFGSGAA